MDGKCVVYSDGGGSGSAIVQVLIVIAGIHGEYNAIDSPLSNDLRATARRRPSRRRRHQSKKVICAGRDLHMFLGRSCSLLSTKQSKQHIYYQPPPGNGARYNYKKQEKILFLILPYFLRAKPCIQHEH